MLEDGIAKAYAWQEGVKLTKPTWPFGMTPDGVPARGPIERFDYPTWAQIDRIRVGKPRRGVEIKHTANLSRFSDEAVPDDVAVQVQHAMMLTGWQSFDVVSLSGGRDLKVTTVEADPEVHEAIADACRTFWRQVQTGEQPEPDGSDAAGRYIRQRYNATEPGKIAVATHDVLPQIAEVLRLAAEKKEVERQLDEAKQRIMLFMEDAERLEAPGDVRITWKEQDGRRDWKAIAADLRRIIEAEVEGISLDGNVPIPTTDALAFVESMHTGEPTRVFRVHGKAVML
jgi:predicted phage-related endonuclease